MLICPVVSLYSLTRSGPADDHHPGVPERPPGRRVPPAQLPPAVDERLRHRRVPHLHLARVAAEAAVAEHRALGARNERGRVALAHRPGPVRRYRGCLRENKNRSPGRANAAESWPFQKINWGKSPHEVGRPFSWQTLHIRTRNLSLRTTKTTQLLLGANRFSI